MAKAKEVNFFYAGVVLSENRPSVLFFDGILTDTEGLTFNQVRNRIKRRESRNHNGAKVALTILVILQK